jgi:hypothetical protein
MSKPKAAEPRQLNADDVHRLFVAKEYDLIEAARKAGELAELLGTNDNTD